MELNANNNASPLVHVLINALGYKTSGLTHGTHLCETPLDRVFSRLAASYNTFDNKFLRAELAEKILISCLMEESEQAITYWARRKENGIGEIEPDPMLKNPKFYIHNIGEKAQRIREGNTSAAGRRRKKRNRKKTTEVEEE